MIRRLLVRESVRASLVLTLVLGATFFPVFWGGKTLLLSAGDAASIMPGGAYYSKADKPRGIRRTVDGGAPAWQSEAWIKVISRQLLQEHRAPLWNPYAGFGTPLSATMQPQPFYPLTTLLSLHPTASTYNFYLILRLFTAGLLTFLFARLFLRFVPSLFSAIAFMLTGYFTTMLGMPHLSVEVLLPGLFLAFELLLRRNSWGTIAGAAGIIFLAVLGGMPESLFLIYALAALYFLFRLFTVVKFRERWLSSLSKFALATTLGFSLSAFLLFPFLELMGVSHDVHQPSNIGGAIIGLVSDHDPRQAVTYLLPMLFGPIGWEVRGYWGIIPSAFAGLAVIAALLPARFNLSPQLRALTFFFAATVTLMVLKRFGSPVINWIGLLPLAEMVLYPKYQEPLIGFCVAMLGGIGLSQLGKNRIGRIGLSIAAALLLGGMIAVAVAAFPTVSKSFHLYYFITLLSGVIVVLGIMLLASVRSVRANYVAWGFAGFLFLELCFNFIVPSFYLFHRLPSTKQDPYKGAPYIAFLQEQNQNHERVFGRGGVLFPNWSGAFDLADVRNLDGMYYGRYMHFIRNFLRAPEDEARGGDLADRFTGGRARPKYRYDFETERERRFLALSSVRHVLTPSAADPALPFPNVYDKEVQVYEVPEILPRASVFGNVEILPVRDILDRLKAPDFDHFNTVVLPREGLSKHDFVTLETFAESSGTFGGRAHIKHYDSQRVVVEAETPSPAVLMLNDTNYPGWQAYVNGEPARLFNADYLFRGVLLPKGKSEVVFAYEPVSYRLGLLISAIALGVLVAPPLLRRFRRRAQRGGVPQTARV